MTVWLFTLALQDPSAPVERRVPIVLAFAGQPSVADIAQRLIGSTFLGGYGSAELIAEVLRGAGITDGFLSRGFHDARALQTDPLVSVFHEFEGMLFALDVQRLDGGGA